MTVEASAKKFQRSPKDTGSPEVQIAQLTDRINELTEHLKIHKKDNHSRHGLLQMVSGRRRLMKYLKKENADIYKKLLTDLNLRDQ